MGKLVRANFFDGQIRNLTSMSDILLSGCFGRFVIWSG
ncbi:hypothetical protein LINPERHAP2_LOCUS14513 [Linum perenne]